MKKGLLLEYVVGKNIFSKYVDGVLSMDRSLGALRLETKNGD